MRIIGLIGLGTDDGGGVHIHRQLFSVLRTITTNLNKQDDDCGASRHFRGEGGLTKLVRISLLMCGFVQLSVRCAM